MSWLAPEAAMLGALRGAGLDAHSVASRAELVQLAAGTATRWRGVAVVYGGYVAESGADGCTAMVTQSWWTYCVLWDVEGAAGAHVADSEAMADGVIAALLGLKVHEGFSGLALASAGPASDDAGSRLLPLRWQCDFAVSAEG